MKRTWDKARSPDETVKRLYEVGREYWVQGRNATLIELRGTEAVCRDRWDCVFTVTVADLQAKP